MTCESLLPPRLNVPRSSSIGSSTEILPSLRASAAARAPSSRASGSGMEKGSLRACRRSRCAGALARAEEAPMVSRRRRRRRRWWRRADCCRRGRRSRPSHRGRRHLLLPPQQGTLADAAPDEALCRCDEERDERSEGHHQAGHRRGEHPRLNVCVRLLWMAHCCDADSLVTRKCRRPPQRLCVIRSRSSDRGVASNQRRKAEARININPQLEEEAASGRLFRPCGDPLSAAQIFVRHVH